MDLILDRSSMYGLISALELDLRRSIENHLLVNNPETAVLGTAYSLALARANKDADRDFSQPNLLDYLELSDEIEILNRNRPNLPDTVAVPISRHSVVLQELIPIRHRVMHTRSLLPDDAWKLLSTVRALLSDGFDGPSIKDILGQLEVHPGWSPPNFVPVPSERVLNNLPMPDYDETGLIGRRKMVEEIKLDLIKMGRGGRSKVLTIVGPGGLGKTAVALEALYELVEDPQCPFDLVSWVSLKTERLTASGVQELVDAVRGIDEAISVLAAPLEGVSGTSIQQLGAALEFLEVNALLVIDNLETVSGEEILSILDQLPDSVSYLFTSREGLGQVERRRELAPLDPLHAVQLLRSTFRARGLKQFAAMNESTASEAVRGLGYSPLGIKWFASGVEVGKDPADLLRHPEDLVRFCVENVFESLDAAARSVALALVAVSRPVAVGELRVILPDVSGDSLRRALQALLRRMFVNRALVDGLMVESFEASPALTAYLSNPSVADADAMLRFRETDAQFRMADDRHRVEAEGDPLRPNIIQGVIDHPGLATLLRSALSCSKAGNFTSALRQLDIAEEIDPSYWEIFRVRGFVLSCQGSTSASTQAYEKAVELAPNEISRAIAQYFFAGHVLRREVDSMKAERLARMAHEVLEAAKSALQLGTALTYLGSYDEAGRLLTEAAASSNRQTRLIATTQLVDCLRRHAEHLVTGAKEPIAAVATLESALAIVDDAVDKGTQDPRLIEKAQSALTDCLRYLVYYPDVAEGVDVPRLLDRVERFSRMNPSGKSLDFLHAALRRFEVENVGGRADLARRTLAEERLALEEAASRHGSSEARVGLLKVWLADQHYGFIATAEYPGNLFTHVTELADPSDEVFLASGTRVTFVPGVGREGQDRGRQVKVVDKDEGRLQHRRVQVVSVAPKGGYVLAVDVTSGATVFIGRHVMESGSAWFDVIRGSFLEVDIEFDDLGRFRASTATLLAEGV